MIKAEKMSTGRSVVMGREGMVASAHPLATLAGVEVLKRGGNAADAALATAAVLDVVQPMMCGLGGDAFVLVHSARTGRIEAINGSGVAPSSASRERYLAEGYREMPIRGLWSAAVPGAVSAYETLLARHGTRSLAELFEPAIHYAERGFAVTEKTRAWFVEQAGVLAQYPATAAIFLPQGRPPEVGEVLVQKDLAESLRLVARGGSEVFYRGQIAQAIHDYSRQNGGLMTERELREHETFVLAPLSTTYRGYEICQTPPVSQGLIHLEEMNIIEGFDLRAMGHNSADAIHVMSEAKRIAFADRLKYVGDPAFIEFPLKTLLSKEYAAGRRSEIRLDQLLPEESLTLPELDGDTTYFCVVDGEGNAISFIQSLSHAFGSAVVVPGTGILLNNRAGRGFTLEEGHPNCLAPGKRTMHTLNCFIVLKGGRPYLVGGTPGGDGQPQWNMQLSSNMIDFGLDVQAAIEVPRWTSFPGTDPANAGFPLELRVEERVGEEVISRLRSKGHRVQVQGPWAGGGGAQLIMIDRVSGVLHGGSDPRMDGAALGY